METLIQLDQELLLHLNSFTSPLFDNFFWVVTSKSIWFPMYAFILYVIFRNQGVKGIITVFALALMVLLCDQISTNIFKEGFERFRPSHEPSIQGLVDLINGKRGGKYGFVSSHATNSFGLASFFFVVVQIPLVYSFYSFLGCIEQLFKDIYGCSLPRRHPGRTNTRVSHRLVCLLAV